MMNSFILEEVAYENCHSSSVIHHLLPASGIAYRLLQLLDFNASEGNSVTMILDQDSSLLR